MQIVNGFREGQDEHFNRINGALNKRTQRLLSHGSSRGYLRSSMFGYLFRRLAEKQNNKFVIAMVVLCYILTGGWLALDRPRGAAVVVVVVCRKHPFHVSQQCPRHIVPVDMDISAMFLHLAGSITTPTLLLDVILLETNVRALR